MQTSFFQNCKRVFSLAWAPIVVLSAHTISMKLTNNTYQWDELMHFFGGMAIAWTVLVAMRMTQKANVVPMLPRWFEALFVIGLLMMVGVLWERYEYVRWITISPWMDLTLADTLKDLAYDLGGAMALLLTQRVISRKNQPSLQYRS